MDLVGESVASFAALSVGSVPVDPVDLQKGGGPQGEEWRHHEREEWPRGARVKTAMMARRAAARRWAFR